METKKNKINLFWLSKKGLMRFKIWFILKLMIILIWGFTIFNFYSIYTAKLKFFETPMMNLLLIYLLCILNFVLLIFFLTITILTLRLRQSEFGLYRCCGATRNEMMMLIFNESFLLVSFGFLFLFILEMFFLFYFKLEIAGILKLAYDIHFFFFMAKNFLFTYLFLFFIVIFCYLPLALYYAFKDPYYIVRY